MFISGLPLHNFEMELKTKVENGILADYSTCL